MKVLVDTDVWSGFLRRKAGAVQDWHEDALRDLIRGGRVQMIGVIRMEILCGIRSAEQFAKLSRYLEVFPDRSVSQQDWVLAARFFNICRSRGIQGSNTDFLICACAVAWEMPILSKDQDYRHFAEHLPIELME